MVTGEVRRLKGQEATTGQGTEGSDKQGERMDSKYKQLNWKDVFTDLFMHADE